VKKQNEKQKSKKEFEKTLLAPVISSNVKFDTFTSPVNSLSTEKRSTHLEFEVKRNLNMINKIYIIY
jgi:hypothetical protein